MGALPEDLAAVAAPIEFVRPDEAAGRDDVADFAASDGMERAVAACAAGESGGDFEFVDNEVELVDERQSDGEADIGELAGGEAAAFEHLIVGGDYGAAFGAGVLDEVAVVDAGREAGVDAEDA